MGKHFKMTCWRCGNEDWASRVSPVTGCRGCAPAKGTPEHKVLVQEAGRGLGNGNLKHHTLYEQALAAFTKANAEREQAEAENRARIEAKKAARRAKQEAAQPQAPRPSAPRAKSSTGRQVDPNAVVDRILFEMDFTEKVEAALAALPKVPRCNCCPEIKALTETGDGKLFCPVCAYGVLRSGFCTFHNTEHYPEIAASAPRVPLYEFPRELLGTDPAKFKPENAAVNLIVDP